MTTALSIMVSSPLAGFFILFIKINQNQSHELYISSLADSPFHPDIKISGNDNKRYRIEGNVKNQRWNFSEFSVDQLKI